MGQYWFGETNPKQAFRNAFKNFLQKISKKNYLTEFSTD